MLLSELPPATYLSHARVTAVHVDATARPTRRQDGYGNAIPTRYRLRLDDKRWRRVYVIQWSNAGSVYVNVRGVRHFLDDATRYAIEDARGYHA